MGGAGGLGAAGGAGGLGGAGTAGGAGGVGMSGQPGMPGTPGQPPDYLTGEVNKQRTDIEQLKIESKWLMDTVNTLLYDLQGGVHVCLIKGCKSLNLASVSYHVISNINKKKEKILCSQLLKLVDRQEHQRWEEQRAHS